MTETTATARVFESDEMTEGDPNRESILKKITLPEGEGLDMPDLSFAAGSLRGVVNKDGVKVGVFDKVDDEIPAESTPTTNDDDGFLMRNVEFKELTLPQWVKPVQMAAAAISAVWLLFAGASLLMGTGVSALAPHELGGMMAGILAPVALLWLGLTHVTRTYDAQRYGEALRAELHSLIFPSEDRQQRISHDIEKLCQQAAELSTASRTVLKAIQKSRQALQAEAKDFALLSRKAEVHIDRLAENLHERAGKLLSVTEEIERRTANIDSQTTSGAAAWDKTAEHIIGKATQIEEALGRGADRILDAANGAQTKTVEIEQQLNQTFDHLSGSIDNVAERLAGLSSEFDSHGENLSRATERVVDETSRLGQIIQSQISDLEGMSTGVFEQVAKSSEIIKVQRETLDDSARSLNAQAELIAEKIRESATHLDDSAQAVASRTMDIEGRVARQSEGLRTVIADLETQVRNMENSGGAVANRLSEALGVALSGSDTLAGAVRRAVEGLEKAAADARAQAEEIAATTASGVHNLQDASVEQMARAENLVSRLAESRELLLGGAAKADEQAREVLKLYENQSVSVGLAVTTLSERLIAASGSLETPLRAVNAAVAEADRRHEMIEQTLARRIEDLGKSSDKARDTAEQISTLLRAQAQDMSILSGQISGQVRSIGDQIGQQKDMLTTHAERAVTDLTRVHETLERQVENLQSAASMMGSDLSRLHDRVLEKTSTLKQETEQMTDRLGDVDTRIGQSVVRLSDQSQRLRETVGAATEALDHAMDHAEPIYRRAIEQASATQDRMEQMNRTFEATSTSNLERLQQVGIIFDERLSQLRSGVQDAAQILRSSGDELRNRVDDIETATTNANDRMGNVSKVLNNQIADIHLLTDQALLKVEAVQRAVETQFHELNAAVGKAVAELQGAQDQFGDATRALETQADSSVRKLQNVARDTVGEGHMLQGAAAAVVKTTQDMIATLQAETKGLLASANDALMDVKKLGDSFALRAREVEEHMKSSLNTSQTYSQDLKLQVSMIAEASVDTADKVAKSVSLLNAKIGEVERSALLVGDSVEQIRGKLEGETDRFMSTAKHAIDTAEEASSSYVRQSNVLFKAAQEASAQVEKIRDVHWRTQRDNFLSSAKFVVESLHSLAVDFVRVLDGEVQEKTWKAFQKGDVAAFTRRLVDGATQIPVDKIRAKFTADNEFRSYVQRYIRVFEELFDQAMTNDHGELLAATFLSSDVGKLYQMLCNATGREAKMGRDLTRAA